MDIESIENRLKATTPGNWYIGSEGLDNGWCGIYAGDDELVVGRVESEDVEDVEAMDNAEFICNAKGDIQDLLAANKEAARRIAELEGALRESLRMLWAAYMDLGRSTDSPRIGKLRTALSPTPSHPEGR